MYCSIVFARWRQCAFPCGHIDATWRIRLNLCFLRLRRVHNPDGKSIGSAVFAQIMADTLQWVPLFSRNWPFPWDHGGSGLPSNDSFSPSEPTTQTALSVQPFLHRWLQSVPILYNGTPLPPSKLPLPMGGSGHHLIHGSLGPPESSTQTASRSVQPFLQGLLVWDRATNRPCYSVGNNRPHRRCDLTIVTMQH